MGGGFLHGKDAKKTVMMNGFFGILADAVRFALVIGSRRRQFADRGQYVTGQQLNAQSFPIGTSARDCPNSRQARCLVSDQVIAGTAPASTRPGQNAKLEQLINVTQCGIG